MLRSTRFHVYLTALLMCVLPSVSAMAASPSLGIILPRGCQRGADSVLTFSGARLADCEEIFLYDQGIQVTKIEPDGANKLKVSLKVAPNCRLGEHVAQVRTKSGVSEFRTFYVGPFAAQDEKEPNTDFKAPQKIPLNITVHGVVQSEDVDYFVVEAKQGQRISAEVEGMRLGTTLFDPYVAILDTDRFELASGDDVPLVKQDGIASVVAPKDGQYIVEVRESAYGGNGNCRYRLHVGTFPRPTAVYPPGGKVGSELEVTFLGDPAGEFKQTIQLPSEKLSNYGLEAKSENTVAPSSNPFRLFEYGNVLETEPNNDLKQATAAQLPMAFNGIIAERGDIDCFRFAAKKGQVFEIECYARRVRSPLDPVVNLYYANGKSIAGNDDSRGPDSFIRFSVPADGDYILRITDHLGRGGKDYVYRLELTPRKPSLTLGIPRVARYSQYRQWIVVPRGNRFATLVSASRGNFGGEILLEPQDMPQGITIHALPMASNLNVMPVVLEAAADAPIAGKLVDFTGRHADPKQNIRGGYRNSADFIRGRPGQSIYWRVDVERIPVCVVEEVPFRLEIVQPKVPIVHNGSMQLKVVAHKQKGWDEQINVQFPFRPPGIGASSSVNIPKGKNEVLYPLSANSKAQIKKWPVYVIGSADVSGSVWVASQLATLETAEPYVSFAMQRAATEQGRETEIVCQVSQAKPFSGKAKVQLLGLPAKTSTHELELTKDMKELVFKVKTAKDTRPGNHKNIFCRVTISQQGEPITHARVGNTQLRVDKPLPPKKNEPAKPKAAAVAKKTQTKKPEPPQPVRLTRLQKLRLDAKKKREAAGAAGGGSD